MKNNSIIVTTLYNEAEIQSALLQRDYELKHQVQKSARHFAERNLPALVGDSMAAYIGEFKSGYERTASTFLQQVQPEAHFPEGKLDITRGREKESNLQWQIEQEEAKNEKDSAQLGNFHPKSIMQWVRTVVWIFLIIMLGEILYNTKAFEVIGETLLFALLLSLGTTVAIFVFGDLAAMLYKHVQTKIQKILVVFGALLIVGTVFYGLAVWRSSYLAAHGTTVNPWLFVVFNLFYFIVSSLVSYFFLPSWQELKEHMRLMKIYRPLHERKQKVETMRAEMEQLKDSLHEMTKARVRSLHYSQYVTNTISKMYYEAIGLFVRINLMYRLDRKTPDCFALEIPKPDLGNVDFKSLNSNSNAA